MVELYATSGFYGKRIIHFKICCKNPAATKPHETLASFTFHLQLRLDRFSNAGTAARRDR